ncbi:MAG: hypothetical protein KAI47_08950 [Deltaproteobacteria bacterium]|nr:hypothetical protein [Deltaproteobacteria bacterium]
MTAVLAHLPPPSTPPARWAILALIPVTLLFAACPGHAPPPPPSPDPTVSVMDRIIARGTPTRDTRGCLYDLARQKLCPPDTTSPPRVINLRVALDPRYRRWPKWAERLGNTLICVNTLYRETGIRWHIAGLTPWDPGAERHTLYPLLARLRREIPGDAMSLRLGITVWETRHIYRMKGGEIGLSQAGACVVPSWPRVENDCLILAHELGHLIGARHVPGARFIMGRAAHTVFYLPAQDPLSRVTASYRFHPRNLAAIRAYRTARLTRNGLRPTLACRARIHTLDRCYGL